MTETARATATDNNAQAENSRVIAALSQKSGVAEREVGAVYTQEFARIAAQARIRSFVAVLALHNTRRKLGGMASQAAPR